MLMWGQLLEQEEREKRLETMFEATDNRDDAQDQAVEVGSKKTQETLTAADSIIEAVDMADSEIERLRLHKVTFTYNCVLGFFYCNRKLMTP